MDIGKDNFVYIKKKKSMHTIRKRTKKKLILIVSQMGPPSYIRKCISLC